MIEIDGSFLEGGGQIVRTSLALSAITQKPFHITSIRKNRSQPGLKNQHLFCVQAVQKLCNAKVEGDFIGSTEITFIPGPIEGKTISVDIQTAGSVALLLQAALPPAIFADRKVHLKIRGGTIGTHAAPYEYFENVLLPHLGKFADIKSKLVRRGYFPKGNGEVELFIKPKFTLKDDIVSFNNLRENGPKINLTEQHSLVSIKGISHTSSDLEKAEVAERQAKGARQILSSFNVPVSIRAEYSQALSTGSGITLWAIFSKDPNEIDENNPIRLGADALGERGKRAEAVGEEAASRLRDYINSKAPCDPHLADQILPFMALTSNSTIKTSEITNHARTNIYTIEKFLGKVFEVDEKEKIIRTA
ncbi:RNA 3'-terminal phosphate cyclase [Candidatus Woesearchaeota archaeon]|nr:RNA 3'-terminal phosphate cyclase [Candidatus Woesearchaeota archaeon]